MKVLIHPSWSKVLKDEFNKSYFKDLVSFVKTEYKNNKCYPPGNSIFKAFDKCHFNSIKVVVIGQDPYHGFGQANGLCFSVFDGIKHPPSLVNIFKEMESDLKIKYPLSGDLTYLTEQGVLLLNSTLTVQENRPGSHQNKGWEIFTDKVIELISLHREKIVFLLWGGQSKKKTNLIDSSKHFILKSGHPSPLSANKGYWFGNKHFSKTNDYLKQNRIKEINWG
tara:strand:+ start:1019 stop:1687 length:669 start_codon:yes stop_codon:yes gene_type:complete